MATAAVGKDFEEYQTPSDTFAYTLFKILRLLTKEGLENFLNSLPGLRPNTRVTLDQWTKEDRVLVDEEGEPPISDRISESLQSAHSDEPWQYDEVNTPCNDIPVETWKEIPLGVRDLIKQVEKAQRNDRWFIVFLGLLSGLALASALVGFFLIKQVPSWTITATIFVSILIMLISSAYLLFYSYILWNGKSGPKTIRLRPIRLAEFAWEHLPIMDLLRREGNFLYFRGRSFDLEEITGDRILAYLALLLAIISISVGGLNLLEDSML
jgi:hypothetical protein